VKILVNNRFAALDEDVNNNDVDFPALGTQKTSKKAMKEKLQKPAEANEMDVDPIVINKKTISKEPTPPKSKTEMKGVTLSPKTPKTAKKKDVPIIAVYNTNPKELAGKLRQIIKEHFTLNIVNKNMTHVKTS